jgi:hypothetical protein
LRLARAGKITIVEIADAARPPYDPEPVVGPIADPEGTPEVGIEINQLSGRTCRWPLWGNEKLAINQMKFCGKTTVTSCSPYCGEHATTAWRSVKAPADRG